MTRTRLRFLAGLAIFAAIPAVACGGDDDDGANVVNVGLNEWQVTRDPSNPPAGEVTFRARNTGTIPHELVVIKTDLASGQLPVSGGKVDEARAGKTVGEIEEFGAGKTESATFKLESGRYALICNITGHYQAGMHAALNVP